MATLKAELANAKASNLFLVEVATRSEAAANKALTNWQKLLARLVKIEKKAEVAREYLDKHWKQSA